MTTYDPSHLRNAATFLETMGLCDASNVLRNKADAIQKENLEKELNFKIGSHFRDLVKQRNGWTFNAVSNAEIAGFGKAARDAVEAHCPKSKPMAGAGSSPYTARSAG